MHLNSSSIFDLSIFRAIAFCALTVLFSAILFPQPASAQHPFKVCINHYADASNSWNQCYVETKVCNKGEIDVYAFVAHAGDTAKSRHKSFGWYEIKQNRCQLVSYQWSFGLAFMAAADGSSIILDKDNGEITYNYGRGDKTRGNDWQNSPGFICVPEGASGRFETTFQTWNYDAACKKGFLRFPLSNWVTPYERQRWNYVKLKIKPKRTDPNRVQVAVYDDGSRYVGQLRYNQWNGRGVLTWPDGDKYEGEFKDNKKIGRGVYTWSNGDAYDGEWKDNKMNGHGEIMWSTRGGKYVGGWRDGKKSGHGVYTKANGDSCEGEWRDHKLAGKGEGVKSGVPKACYPKNNNFTFKRPW